MHTSPDLDAINTRITQLASRYVAPLSGGDVPAWCEPMVRAVTHQALVSGQGGKRLRALLTMAAYDAAGFPAEKHGQESRDTMLNLACAVEVFQTAALVHDDIIDDSDLRRGRPAAHVALSRAARAIGNDVSRPAGGEPTGKRLGIMLGDLMATASVAIAHDAAGQLQQSSAVMDTVLRMHREVEVGQVLDLAMESLPLDDPARLAETALTMFRWKTASYTTIAPIELGLLAAGMPLAPAHDVAGQVGGPLGVAFQLGDDLLDVVGVSEATGKPVGGDIREGKRTVLLADALTLGNDNQRRGLLDAYRASTRGDAAVDRVIALLHHTGAIDRSRERITRLWRRADDALDRSSHSLGFGARAQSTLRTACSHFISDPALRISIS